MGRFRYIEDIRSWDYPNSVRPKIYRWSVGFYRGHKRVVVARFCDEYPAAEYCVNCRRSRPDLKFDYLQSFF